MCVKEREWKCKKSIEKKQEITEESLGGSNKVLSLLLVFIDIHNVNPMSPETWVW